MAIHRSLTTPKRPLVTNKAGSASQRLARRLPEQGDQQGRKRQCLADVCFEFSLYPARFLETALVKVLFACQALHLLGGARVGPRPLQGRHA